MATPVLQISINGQDVSSRINARVLTGRVVRFDGQKTDSLSLTLANFDGLLAKPQRGAKLQVALGFKEFGGATDRGIYIVEHVVKRGGPAVFEVTARSADLKATLKQQKTRTWPAPTTLGTVLNQIASDNGLTPAIDGALASVSIDNIIAQTGESDMHLFTRLARRFGATGKIASGRLVFVPAGAGTTASGVAAPSVTLTPEDCESFSIGDDDRHYRGITHSRVWSRATAKAMDYSGSAGDKGPDYTHPETFGQPAEAQAQSHARAKEFARAKTTFDAKLRPPASIPQPGGTVTSSGFGDDDDHDWIAKSVVDEFDENGLVSGFKAERKV